MVPGNHSSRSAEGGRQGRSLKARRRYWTEQMEGAHDFMQRLHAHPVAECGEPLRLLEPAAREAGIRIEFAAGLKLGELQRVFALRASLLPRLLVAAAAMLRQGWLLRLEDAYRSLAVQAQGTSCDFIVDTVRRRTQWELGGRTPSLELVLRRIRVLTATTAKSANHVSGSAMDISVLNAADGREVDRGGSYLEISERTPMESPFLSRTARHNRDRINEILAAQGFLPYPYEFWHFSHGDADFELVSGSGRPARFGPVDLEIASGRVTPVPDPFAELLQESEVRLKIGHLCGGGAPGGTPPADGGGRCRNAVMPLGGGAGRGGSPPGRTPP